MPINERRELIEAYEDNLIVLRTLVQDLPEETIKLQGTGSERWSILEIVCHLRDSEERSLADVRKMMGEDRPYLFGFDPDELAAESDYQSQSFPDALDAFERIRVEHIDFLRTLSDDDWQREADSEDFDEVTLQEHTGHMTRHDGLHLAQISRRIQETRS